MRRWMTGRKPSQIGIWWHNRYPTLRAIAHQLVYGLSVTVLIALVPFGTPLVWGVLVVSWVDNVVRTMLLSRASHVPFILALFGVLGGLAAFGTVGLFLGQVILAVAVWREWL